MMHKSLFALLATLQTSTAARVRLPEEAEHPDGNSALVQNFDEVRGKPYSRANREDRVAGKICDKSYEGDRCDRMSREICEEGLKHGRGRCKFDKTDSTYDGDWKNGHPTGFGKLDWAQGDTYDGAVVNGTMNGQGTYEFADGDIFIGEFFEGEMLKGQLHKANGDFYDGRLKENLPDGWGKYNFKTGGNYEGNFVQNIRQGKGTYTFPSGAAFTGIFKDGAVDATQMGTMKHTNGDTVTGKHGTHFQVIGPCTMKQGATGRSTDRCCNGAMMAPKDKKCKAKKR